MTLVKASVTCANCQVRVTLTLAKLPPERWQEAIDLPTPTARRTKNVRKLHEFKGWQSTSNTWSLDAVGMASISPPDGTTQSRTMGK